MSWAIKFWLPCGSCSWTAASTAKVQEESSARTVGAQRRFDLGLESTRDCKQTSLTTGPVTCAPISASACLQTITVLLMHGDLPAMALALRARYSQASKASVLFALLFTASFSGEEVFSLCRYQCIHCGPMTVYDLFDEVEDNEDESFDLMDNMKDAYAGR